MKNSNKDGLNIKRYLPGVGLLILTIGLIFFFKSRTATNLIESGKENLSNFYSANLKPILVKSDLTEEDLFNFALYESLPVDKEKRNVLQIGRNEAGEEYVEIKPAIYNPNTENYAKFKKYFNTNEQQEENIDSILNYYRKDLAKAVLIDENDHVAINRKLADIRNAMFTDLLAYSHEIDEKKWDRFVNWKFDPRRIPRARSFAKSISKEENNDYIVFTPDTVVTRSFIVEASEAVEAASAEEFASMGEGLGNIKIMPAEKVPEEFYIIEKVPSEKSTIYNYSYTKAKVSPDSRWEHDLYRDSLIFSINEVEKSIKDFNFSFGVDTSDNSLSFAFEVDSPDTTVHVGFEMDVNGLQSLISTSISAAMSGKEEEWIEFGMQMDSLAKVFATMNHDSLINLHDSLYLYDAEKLKKELIKKKKKKSD